MQITVVIVVVVVVVVVVALVILILLVLVALPVIGRDVVGLATVGIEVWWCGRRKEVVVVVEEVSWFVWQHLLDFQPNVNKVT